MIDCSQVTANRIWNTENGEVNCSLCHSAVEHHESAVYDGVIHHVACAAEARGIDREGEERLAYKEEMLWDY